MVAKQEARLALVAVSPVGAAKIIRALTILQNRQPEHAPSAACSKAPRVFK